ncbi:zinc-ribbon domain-containing protein [Streptococcus suis]|nr:zinc-ribbon domain-containing protein [Streptococcus suis]MDY7600099.1 zinc-ribbon domain-containing protein [Streptococcus suis]
MHEWDYLNNLLIASPTEITELSNMSIWWICLENPDHRYKIQVKERMAYRK